MQLVYYFIAVGRYVAKSLCRDRKDFTVPLCVCMKISAEVLKRLSGEHGKITVTNREVLQIISPGLQKLFAFALRISDF